MVLDIISLVKDLARDIYVASHFLKENRQTCLKIYDKLREIQSFIGCSELVSGDSVRERVLSSIEGDVLSVREEFEEIKAKRPRKIRKFLTGSYEAQKLNSMLSTCISCQQRLEVILCTTTRNNQEFSSLISNVKDCDVGKSGMADNLVGVSDDFPKNMSVVQDAVKSIPLSITPDSNLDVLSMSSTTAERSDVLPESCIDEEERISVDRFSQLPSAVCELMLEFARKRPLPEDVTNFLENINKMWNGWRIDVNDVEYDEMSNRKPYKIGKGANSVVYSAKYKTFRRGSGELSIPVAVKEIDVEDFSNESEKGDLLREFFLQLALHNPYIIQTYGICWPSEVSLEYDTAGETQVQDETGEEDRTVRIVMERRSCNLRYALKKNILQTSEDKIRVLRDLCKALSYLHERNIVHRDVKPENVLLSTDGNGMVGVAKLADFGCSRFSHDRRLTQTMSSISAARGTTIYTPPEVLENLEECHTRKSWDVWSYGLVICNVFSPTQSDKLSTLRVMNHWKKGILIERLQQVAANIEDETFKKLAMQCLSANENDRPRISEIEKVLDERFLESAMNREVDEITPLDEIGEDSDEGLKRRDMESGNQFPIGHGNPAYAEADDTTQHDGTDGQYDSCAQAPEDSVEPHYTSDSWTDTAQNGRACGGKVEQLNPEIVNRRRMHAKGEFGWCSMSGIGVEQELSKAVQLYKEAADRGSTDAKNKLGVCHLNEIGVERDYSIAVQLFKEAVGGGNVDAKVNLGLCYQNGTGVKRDVSKAVQLYEGAADEGNTYALLNLGLCYGNGTGVEQDDSKAAELYKEAADRGNAVAKNTLAICYYIGIGVEKDVSKAVQQYKEAVAGGNVVAKVNLGFCYEKGIGVEEDTLKAVQLYKEAAYEGNTDAKNNLGVCFENGIGVERDVLKAVHLYQEAADKGNTDAKSNLGFCYCYGTGVEKDVLRSLPLFIEAADEGNVAAKNKLGTLYQEGIVVERNVAKATQLFIEAENGRDPYANLNSGLYYRDRDP